MGRKQKGGGNRKILQYIKQVFVRNPESKFSSSQIKRKLKLKNSKQEIDKILRDLEDKRVIRNEGKGKYSIYLSQSKRGANDKETTGFVDLTSSGAGYIMSSELDDDIFVSSKNLGTAFHGDLVKVKYFYPRKRRKPEGKIIQVLERSSEVFLGTISNYNKYSIVYVERNRTAIEITVYPNDIMDAEDGERVVVEVTKWPSKMGQSPIGKVTQLLGSEDNNDVRMKSILINNGFNLNFSSAVLAESEAISEEITKEEVEKRRDMRDVLTFTIDPVDAKDFDDAISYQILENGNTEIGVHIADVSHYVLPGTELDKEAIRRSTSVYLVDRVLPMLPEKLSNVLCSLRPNEDKLAYSVLFEMDQSHSIVNKWIGRTIIHSDRRFSYESAQELLDGKEDDLTEILNKINDKALHLRESRFNSGSINFFSTEVRFELDETGKPIDALVKETGPSNHLIEEFMLLANKSISISIKEKNESPSIPFIYRVHDLPDAEKVRDITVLAGELGLVLDTSTPEKIAKSFNAITEKAQNDPAYKILSHLAIRAMAKAEYSSDNIGHYGLGFKYYSHFTSPIRRYSDVIAHRILFMNEGKQVKRVNKAELEEQCQHISRQERKAVRAERESIKIKQIEYAEGFKGQVIEGVISGMIERGIFIEVLKSRSEGLISFDKFNERFEIVSIGAKARGTITGQELKIGDKLMVRIIDTDLDRKQIDFELVLDED